MPTPEQILSGLREIANGWGALAILWHAYFGIALLGLAVGVRPSTRTAGILLGLPVLSVSALAWASSNPFNGMFFAGLGLALLAISVRLPRSPVRTAPVWAMILGGFMFSFGWVYPHFLDSPSLLTYSYAAPTGLIPCPTLAIVIGLTVILSGLGSRWFSLPLGASGVFYGIFGSARLGVMIDVVLLVGALLLIFLAFSNKRIPAIAARL